ncbi:MAG: hypothetical protein ACFFCQ_14110 [Promethearchaeota archaeon]
MPKKVRCRLSGSPCEKVQVTVTPDPEWTEIDPTFCLNCPFLMSRLPWPPYPRPDEPRRPFEPFRPDLDRRRPLEF